MLKKLNEKLESIFETNTQDLSLLESRNTFEMVSDNSHLQNLSYVHTKITKDNIAFVFSQLSSFFEVGFLLEKKHNSYAAVHGFAYGQKINLEDKEIKLKLPQTSLLTIVKTPASGILGKMKYGFLDTQKKMNAFIIAINPEFSILLATEIAEPWLKVRLESLQKTLMKISIE